MGRLSSRKLAAVLFAIGGIVGLVLGLAYLLPTIFTESPDVVLTAMGLIAGLGGFGIWRQAIVDEKTPTFRIEGGSTVVKRE